MKTNKEFEHLCRLLLDDASRYMALPKMAVETENLFYENFGMSSVELQEMLCMGERVE